MSGAARRDAERPVETESGAPARFPRVVEYSDERRDATRGREGGEEEEEGEGRVNSGNGHSAVHRRGEAH